MRAGQANAGPKGRAINICQGKKDVGSGENFLSEGGFRFRTGPMRPTLPRRPALVVLAVCALSTAGTVAVFGQETGEAAPPVHLRLADGFDFPVGKPDGVGYHKARGMRRNGHLGDDWDGDGGGNTDLGDPVYAAGAGVVVLAGNMHMGWGNVVMVRHCYREPSEGGAIHTVDSLYGHVDKMLVHEGQMVSRGEQIATIGTAYGLYEAHLHFEVRKNIHIGMYRSQFARDYSNYYNPTEFVETHRRLPTGFNATVAVNTFVPTPRTGLLPADASYELGINRSPKQVAEMESSHLKTSAFAIKPHKSSAEKPDDKFKVDRYNEERKKRE